MDIFSKHSGLSFVELLVSITIMSIVGGIALVSFGSFFAGQDVKRLQANLESRMKMLDLEVENGKTSDYTLTLSGGNIGYIIEKNAYKKPADLLTDFSYDFTSNNGTLVRLPSVKPWTIELYAENKLQKTYITNDSTQKISLPNLTSRHESYMLRSRIDGESTNYYVINFFSPQEKNGVDPIMLAKIVPSSPFVRTNILGNIESTGATLTFEQSSKQFEITLTKE